MSYTNGLDKPSDYFVTKLYTGNGGTQSITGLDFQPDWTWIKGRSGSYGVSNHKVYDVVRGATKTLFVNLTNAESTQTNTLTSFNSDGFSLGNDTNVNASSTNFASWNWKAGGSASSNSNGSITSSVSANQDAGFSIVSYSGNGTAGATIGHGLGAIPKMMIVRKRNSAENWLVYHASTGNTGATLLNGTNAFFQDNMWNSTSPTSSVFTVHGDAGANASGGTYIAYCFAEKQGYSKFGSYVGNGNVSGSYIHLGFKPAFVILKKTSATDDWHIFDNKRDVNNMMETNLIVNRNIVESTTMVDLDFVSNGFKLRNTDDNGNASGSTYIYMAFAESPFVTSTGVPATAR